jgi:DNA-binding GntR family transcriptional regulator
MGRRGQCGILAGYAKAGVLTTDAEFHAIIETGAGIPLVEAVLLDARAAVAWTFEFLAWSPARLTESHAEHRRLVEAIAARDSKGAVRAMREHMAPATRLVQELLEGDGTSLFAQVSAVERP